MERMALRLLVEADAVCNRLYGPAANPLYQSGTIVVLLYLVLLVTGLWLLLFYRVGAPWESVAALTADRWLGNWVRAAHRYASDLAVVATAFHAFRMFAQARSTGARTLAWISGGVLLGSLLVAGWTGYVMVWDTFGQYLAREGARLLDALPILSEPTSRAFTGEQPLPPAFFFLNLFAHVGVPLAMAVLFLLHVKRLARPVLLPPRPLLWGIVGIVTAAAVLRPLAMDPKADALVLPEQVTADLFFAFWVPASQRLGGGTALIAWVAAAAMLLAVPIVMARRGAGRRPASSVDAALCVGCLQCALDCPFGAITMVGRSDDRPELLAQVDPALCVSCGICAGSCSPMGVGPPGRTGRDQVAAARAFAAAADRRAGEVIVIGCEHGAGRLTSDLTKAGAVPYAVDCAGNLHTSVVELLLRAGAGGVLVLACPGRDCRNREGSRWVAERLFAGREAELQPRVDRARVRLAYASGGERARTASLVRAFVAHVATLPPSRPGAAVGGAEACQPTPAEVAPSP
jgi:ferredoxin